MTRRAPQSLRGRLLAGVLAAVALLWAAALLASYRQARHELDELLDAHLAQSAALLAAQAAEDIGEIELEHLPARSAERAPLVVQVWEGDRLRLHSVDAPDRRLSAATAGFSTTTVDGVRWRVYSAPHPEHGLLVQLGEPVAAREHLARAVLARLVWPLLAALPLIGLGVWIAIGRGLAPLRRIAVEIGRRSPLDTQPLGAGDAPREIQPLLHRLNALFARTGESIARERQFTGDASHELRTPIAAIRAQAQVALGARDEAERASALASVIAGCDRAAHLVEQLLVLSRLDATEVAAAPAPAPVALAPIVREVASELSTQAAARGVALSLDIADEAVVAKVDPTLLRIVLRNLLDNALRYGARAVRVAVAARDAHGAVAVTVTDDGPGIPPDLREQARQRFRRLAGQDRSGAGLGLAIVDRIATVIGAELSLHEGPNARGLQARLRIRGNV